MDLKAFEAAGGFEESDEPCELCGEAEQTDANLLLECERCLRGFHMGCLTPPLSHVPEVSGAEHACLCGMHRITVPFSCAHSNSPTNGGRRPHQYVEHSAGLIMRPAAQGDWLCPACAAGEALPPPRPSACTMREKYLSGSAGVELVRITGLDTGACAAGFVFRGQWYERPDTTHCGRQVKLCRTAV